MNDVKVKIDLAKPIGYVGLGIPLILVKLASAPSDGKLQEYMDGVTFDDIKAAYDKDSDMYKAAELIFMQDNKPKHIAICETTSTVVEWLEAKGNLSRNWRQLICIGASDETAEIIAAIEKTDDKMYFASVPADDTTEFDRENVKRTVMLYCSDK